MIISHSHRFILFSNPKTGSESLRKLFAPWSEEDIVPFRARTAAHPYYPHISPTEVEWLFECRGLDFQSYQRITVVRNPFDRLVSLYRMIADTDRLWQIRRSVGLGQPSFPNWLTSTRPDGRGGGGRYHQRWRRYGAWSAENWCAGKVNHILRLEHLETDLAQVLARLNLAPGALPHLNRRPPVDIGAYYDEVTSALVAERYAFDLATFGYAPPVLNAVAA